MVMATVTDVGSGWCAGLSCARMKPHSKNNKKAAVQDLIFEIVSLVAGPTLWSGHFARRVFGAARKRAGVPAPHMLCHTMLCQGAANSCPV